MPHKLPKTKYSHRNYDGITACERETAHYNCLFVGVLLQQLTVSTGLDEPSADSLRDSADETDDDELRPVPSE